MTSLHSDPTATSDRYQALLAVSASIVAHRDLCALFHDLACRLRQVVRFDYLTLVLYEVATNSMRMHVLEPPEPAEPAIKTTLPPALIVAPLLIVIGLCAHKSKDPNVLTAPATTTPPVLSMTTFPAVPVLEIASIVNGA